MLVSVRRTKLSLVCAMIALLSACSGGNWKTDYPNNVSAERASGLRVVSVDVRVPRSLSVSEENSFAPDADIVWREDPPGDRYEQVDAIMTEAVRRGASKLRGGRGVILQIDVQTFHALSQRARTRLSSSGVHNVSFVARLLDASTRAPVVPDSIIQADLIAFVGNQAVEAEAQGLTQKVRITNHVAKVIEGWLGGPDIRGSFSRRGR